MTWITLHFQTWVLLLRVKQFFTYPKFDDLFWRLSNFLYLFTFAKEARKHQRYNE